MTAPWSSWTSPPPWPPPRRTLQFHINLVDLLTQCGYRPTVTFARRLMYSVSPLSDRNSRDLSSYVRRNRTSVAWNCRLYKSLTHNTGSIPKTGKRNGMRQKNHRKGLMFGFSVLAGFLALMSVAYACTVFRGVIGIVGDGSSNHSHKTGSNESMTYCGDGHNHNGAAAFRQGLNDSASDFTLFIDPTTACNGSKLNADNYDLMILGNGSNPFNSDGSVRINCMNGGTFTHRIANSVPVDSAGKGQVSVNLSNSSLKAGPGAVCVADDGDFEGNQVPIDWL